jgi:hypothetical protein
VLNYLLSDKNRKMKFLISFAIVLSLSFFSFNHGEIEPSLKEKIRKNAHKLNSLSYLKRVYNYNDKIKFEDKWDNVWVANWLKNKEVPKMDMLVSFK